MYQSKIVEPEKNIGNCVFMISLVEFRAIYIHSD
ncbi:hypothetical protein BN1180_02911 [Peribacillus simplex]|uniref:Uncharacterized protein n=1 Tax=Peribacillus simplex TaxID=1478 RepID=A0AAN2PHF9_9BACI|nr:hypothetical protein BN1180_02911 [Peribacillus simplex]